MSHVNERFKFSFNCNVCLVTYAASNLHLILAIVLSSFPQTESLTLPPANVCSDYLSYKHAREVAARLRRYRFVIWQFVYLNFDLFIGLQTRSL
jgi:hypothetical protein